MKNLLWFLLTLGGRKYSFSWSFRALSQGTSGTITQRIELYTGRQQQHSSSTSRRQFLQNSILTMGLGGMVFPAQAMAASAVPSLEESLALVRQARSQLAPVPDLIKQEKWDSVRAILITPPLSDCWAKTNRPLLQNLAEAVGEAGKDELAALEAKEGANSHLRYLDAAVYSNNFNPITTAGEIGATQTLIKSYYEDPINEYKASLAALDEIIKVAME